MLEIDIDVGRLLALLRQEALEQEVDLGGIDGGDAETVADRRIGGRPAPLAQDRLLPRPRETDDVMDGEEIARIVELLDQRQLLLEHRPDLGRNAVRIAFARARPGQFGEMLLRREMGGHRLVGYS